MKNENEKLKLPDGVYVSEKSFEVKSAPVPTHLFGSHAGFPEKQNRELLFDQLEAELCLRFKFTYMSQSLKALVYSHCMAFLTTNNIEVAEIEIEFFPTNEVKIVLIPAVYATAFTWPGEIKSRTLMINTETTAKHIQALLNGGLSDE